MAYRIRGLDPAQFSSLEGAGAAALEAAHAVRVVADSDRGYPCRIALADAPRGTPMLLLPYSSQPIPGPYLTRYAIYVTVGLMEPAEYVDQVPAMMARRQVAIRGFGADGMLKTARNVAAGEDLDAAIRTMLDTQDIPAVQVYCCAYGCFLGQADRYR